MDRIFGGKLATLVAHLAERNALCTEEIADIRAPLKKMEP